MTVFSSSSATPCRFRHGRPKGFALIVTISLLLLLALLAVGLLGLSSVALRSAGSTTARAEARTNARLALMLAIGELQRHAGPDTRVTAPADILEADHPPLTGVWRSWEGRDHEVRGPFAGRPIAPDYDSKEKSVADNGRFVAWLVSGDDRRTKPDDAATLVRDAPFENSVALLGGGTLERDDAREVHVETVPVGDRGALAWWVSGENQKARLPRPYEPSEDSAARWSVLAKSHAVADPEPFGLESLLEDPAPAAKAASLATADLLVGAGASTRPGGFFHDLSTVSVGLLTNVATGGWRKDFSLLSESWDGQPRSGRGSGLELFGITPTQSTTATIPTSGNPVPEGSMLYPWATYRGGNNIPIYQHGPVTSWENLVDWATHYKRVSASGGGRMTTPVHSVAIDTNQQTSNFSTGCACCR